MTIVTHPVGEKHGLGAEYTCYIELYVAWFETIPELQKRPYFVFKTLKLYNVITILKIRQQWTTLFGISLS